MKPKHNIVKLFLNEIKRTTCLLLIFFLSLCSAQFSVSIDGGEKNDVSPGDIYTTTIKIINIDTQDAMASIYLSDYQRIYDQPQYQEPNTSKRSNAAWIQLGITELVIPARSEREIPVTVTVPANDNLSGSYWSLIIVEGEAKETTLNTNENSLNIDIVNRHGLNVITNFTKGFFEFAFNSPNFYKEQDDIIIFSVDTVNTGSKIAYGEAYLDLFTTTGNEIGRIHLGTQIFRPENPTRLTFDLTELSTELHSHTYNAIMIIDAGNDNLYGARYNLDIK